MSKRITFHTLGLGASDSPHIPESTSEWLLQAVRAHGREIADWRFVLCTDDHVLRMNQQHLQHDTYTDILTFDYSNDYANGLHKKAPQPAIVGESYISWHRVRAHARAYGVAEAEELCRVMIHGLLHVCGYEDGTPSGRAEMRAAESRLLSKHPSGSMFHVKHAAQTPAHKTDPDVSCETSPNLHPKPHRNLSTNLGENNHQQNTAHEHRKP